MIAATQIPISRILLTEIVVGICEVEVALVSSRSEVRNTWSVTIVATVLYTEYGAGGRGKFAQKETVVNGTAL
jgi:hypothetical protein